MVGKEKKIGSIEPQAPESNPTAPAPVLARRKLNKKSTIRSGRTIGEARERLETKNERAAARKKDKRKNHWRISIVSIIFIIILIVLVYVGYSLLNGEKSDLDILQNTGDSTVSYEPTIEIIDEDVSATEGKLSNRMRKYIGQIEADLKELGLTPTRAVIPTNTIREVDFYIEGYSGFIKTTIDRGAGVTAEDIDRMLRYLAGQGIIDFKYIDVRIDGKAYWQ